MVEMVEAIKLSSSSFGSGLFFNFSNLLLMAKSTPGGLGAFLISSLAISFFPTFSSVSSDLSIGFLASNIEISSKNKFK